MRIYKRKGSPNWWVTWNDQDGKRIRRSSGTDDRSLAQVQAANWVKEDFLADRLDVKPELPFSEVLLRYTKTLKRDKPKHFMTKTRYHIKFLAERFEGFNVSDFTYRAVQDFIDERLETVSSAAALRDLSIVKAAINKARREELTDFVPNFPRIASAKPRNRWITAAEEDRLVDAAAPHLKPVIRFAVDTGGRLSELLGLDWRYVNLNARRVTFVDTKNGDDRTVRLCERARQTLSGLGPKDSGPVFTYNGKPFKDLKHGFTHARTIAGLEDVRFHDLRHTFASRLVQGGVPLFEVMHLTGHKSLSMVQRYSHLAPDFQEGAIRVLDERLKTRDRDSGHDLGTLGALSGVPDFGSGALSH